MRKNLFTLWITTMLAGMLLAACSETNSGAPANAVEEYWEAIAAKDAERLPALVCGNWEEDALTVLDSIQNVSARLEDVACTQTGTEGELALVNCTGNMVLTYDTEEQNIDLSVYTYEVVKDGGDWLVCGTR